MESIIVKATFKVFTNAEGGKRKTPIRSGYSPNHVFEVAPAGEIQNSYIGRITYDGAEWINPGEERLVEVQFLKTPTLMPHIEVNRKWLIYEYPNLIGEAHILEIIA